MKAVIIKTDGSSNAVEFDNSTSYDVMRGAVGGLIERVELPAHEIEMYVNEEGKILRLPINAKATELWAASFGATDIICGDVILVGAIDDEGDNASLTDEQVSTFLAL